MPTKFGRITSFARSGSKFVEAFLSSGERVELPHSVLSHIRATYAEDQELVFVERRGRLFHFVQWVGTSDEALLAAAAGELKPGELPPAPVRGLGIPLDAAAAAEAPADILFGPNGGQVAWFLVVLTEPNLGVWSALYGAELALQEPGAAAYSAFQTRVGREIELAGRRADASGSLPFAEVEEGKRQAEAAALAVVPILVARRLPDSDPRRERAHGIMAGILASTANKIITMLMLRPFMDEDVFADLMKPYSSALPSLL